MERGDRSNQDRDQHGTCPGRNTSGGIRKNPGRYTKEFCDGLRFGRVLCKIIEQG